jgi:hypothetical protein
MVAVQKGHVVVVKSLLEAGAAVNFQCKSVSQLPSHQVHAVSLHLA